MKSSNRILFSCLFVGLASIPGFSQVTNSPTPKDEVNTDPKTVGLKKVASGSQLRNMNFDVNIDKEALEASIELAVERAMQSAEVALEKLEINIEPIEINLDGLDINVDP